MMHTAQVQSKALIFVIRMFFLLLTFRVKRQNLFCQFGISNFARQGIYFRLDDNWHIDCLYSLTVEPTSLFQDWRWCLARPQSPHSASRSAIQVSPANGSIHPTKLASEKYPNTEKSKNFTQSKTSICPCGMTCRHTVWRPSNCKRSPTTDHLVRSPPENKN